MLVRATGVGYGGKDGHALRQPGETFEMPDGAKGSWFEPVDSKKGRQSREGSTENEQLA